MPTEPAAIAGSMSSVPRKRRSTFRRRVPRRGRAARSSTATRFAVFDSHGDIGALRRRDRTACSIATPAICRASSCCSTACSRCCWARMSATTIPFSPSTSPIPTSISTRSSSCRRTRCTSCARCFSGDGTALSAASACSNHGEQRVRRCTFSFVVRQRLSPTCSRCAGCGARAAASSDASIDGDAAVDARVYRASTASCGARRLAVRSGAGRMLASNVASYAFELQPGRAPVDLRDGECDRGAESSGRRCRFARRMRAGVRAIATTQSRGIATVDDLERHLQRGAVPVDGRPRRC